LFGLQTGYCLTTPLTTLRRVSLPERRGERKTANGIKKGARVDTQSKNGFNKNRTARMPFETRLDWRSGRIVGKLTTYKK
jgi:hypothetical protein